MDMFRCIFCRWTRFRPSGFCAPCPSPKVHQNSQYFCMNQHRHESFWGLISHPTQTITKPRGAFHSTWCRESFRVVVHPHGVPLKRASARPSAWSFLGLQVKAEVISLHLVGIPKSETDVQSGDQSEPDDQSVWCFTPAGLMWWTECLLEWSVIGFCSQSWSSLLLFKSCFALYMCSEVNSNSVPPLQETTWINCCMTHQSWWVVDRRQREA